MARKRQYALNLQQQNEEETEASEPEPPRPTVGGIRPVFSRKLTDGEIWSEDDLTTSPSSHSDSTDESDSEEEVWKYYFGAPILLFCFDNGPVSPSFMRAYYFHTGTMLAADWLDIQRLAGNETRSSSNIFSLIYDDESYWNISHKIANPSIPSFKGAGIERVSYDPAAQTIVLRNIINY
jgi:hypothetical protein